MPRPLRFIPEHSLVEITTRTLQGRLLLKPSPELTDIILGIIGKAQALYGMTIHAFVFMSTHAHFLLSPASAGQLLDQNGNPGRVGFALGTHHPPCHPLAALGLAKPSAPSSHPAFPALRAASRDGSSAAKPPSSPHAVHAVRKCQCRQGGRTPSPMA
jgi:hypothetical protein